MKNAVKRAVSLIVFLALLFSMIPTNFVGVFASFASGNGWEQVNSNTFIVYNNKITGSGLIEIFNYFTTNEFDSYRFAYMHPDYAGEVWSNHGIEIVADAEYSIEFSKYGYADIYFCPKPYWNSTETYGIRINYHVAPETEPADPRKPAQVDELINKDLGKFDTESQFESALKSSVSASWSTADGSGKVDQANIIISLAFKGETKNSTGETVRTYSASVSITEGENWLATEQEVVIDGIFWTVNQYVITFDTVGGTQILPIKQDYGTAVALPSNPTKEGYNFIGWDKDIPSTMPAENITVTAMWEEETKTVGFDPNGGKWSDGSGETKIRWAIKQMIFKHRQEKDMILAVGKRAKCLRPVRTSPISQYGTSERQSLSWMATLSMKRVIPQASLLLCRRSAKKSDILSSAGTSLMQTASVTA